LAFIEDSEDLYLLANEEDDKLVLEELAIELTNIGDKLKDIEFESIFSGLNDNKNAVLEIHAGTGGTEAQWWTEQLLRMYLCWFEKKGFKTELLSTTYGTEAGIKSVIVSVNGDYAYGWLKSENGVHRLSRVSEFDSSGRRHTSFSATFIYPFIEEDVEIQIDRTDISIETFRATGPGGQNVNKTDSAVRIKHKSGIVVSCQNERSQRQNKETAFKLLRSRLYDLEIQSKLEEKKQAHKEKSGISWGHQIRSYILNPYQMIKDHRTNKEIGNVMSVLNGNLDPLIKDYLSSVA
jgi:peptide chain release factor 2